MRRTAGIAVRIASGGIVVLLALGGLTGCSLSRQASPVSVPAIKNMGAASPSAGAVAGSAAQPSAGAPATADSAIAPAPTGSGANASTVPADQRLVVRNKTLRLEVKDVPGAIDKLRALTAAAKGDITDMQVATASDAPVYPPMPVASSSGVSSGSSAGSTSSTALNAYLTVRVPASDLTRFADDASKLGRVLFQSESADDVTQQHIDLAARLDNLRAEEARLRDFLNAAHNVTEMLAVESELNRVRGDIESMSAQVAYLERQAALATVTIELVEPQAIVRPAGTDWGWGQTFTDAIRAFVGVVEGIIVVTGALLPLLLLALIAFFIIRALVRRGRKRRAEAAAAVSLAADPGTAASEPSHDEQAAPTDSPSEG